MQPGVLSALALVAVVAAAVFLGARRRASTWLFLAAIAVIAASGVLWTHERPQQRVVDPPQSEGSSLYVSVAPRVELRPATKAIATGPVISTPSAEPNRGTVTFDIASALPTTTTSPANHLPAIIVFGLGAVTAGVGEFLRRRTLRVR